MRRGDVAVLSISAALGAVVVAAVVFSVFVEDRPRGPASDVAADSTSSLLVVTWGPSLCTAERSNPGCRSGHVGKLGPTLILHGLWPQPSTEQFCGLSKTAREGSLSSLNLPQAVQTDLQSKMSDVSIMAPHEWNAHGTCSGLAPPEYFSIAATLAEQASTALDPVFQNGGGRVSLDALRDRLPLLVFPGNHDIGIERYLREGELQPKEGAVIDSVGYLHGHTYPDKSLAGHLMVIGHHHPMLVIRDEVGCALQAPAYVRADLDMKGMEMEVPEGCLVPSRVLFVPAFNEIAGYDIRDILRKPFAPLSKYLKKDGAEIILADGTFMGPLSMLDSDDDN